MQNIRLRIELGWHVV